LKTRLPYHLSAVAQAVGLVALQHSEELMSVVETIRHERDRLFRELSTTNGVTAFESEANFVFFRAETEAESSADGSPVWRALLDRGILIRDFSSLPMCEGHLRVSVGTPEQDERFLEALSEVLGR
jgi:histidinol-phosphate aminotransferase